MRPINTGISVAALALLAGCASNPSHIGVTNPYQPGPRVGHAIGGGVGIVAGNVASGVVGAGEGAAATASVPFDNKTTIIRRWKTVETSDGRVIQVPEDLVIDSNGQVISSAKK